MGGGGGKNKMCLLLKMVSGVMWRMRLRGDHWLKKERSKRVMQKLGRFDNRSCQ